MTKATRRCQVVAADGTTTVRLEPTIRTVEDASGKQYVVELRDRSLTIRPKFGRESAASTWDLVYERCLKQQFGLVHVPARKRVSRGLLSTER